jgi:hypothetical protein
VCLRINKLPTIDVKLIELGQRFQTLDS